MHVHEHTHTNTHTQGQKNSAYDCDSVHITSDFEYRKCMALTIKCHQLQSVCLRTGIKGRETLHQTCT
jgi:NADPH-dependent 7-cyano-7-deazaguanine reductase QueF